MGVLPSGPRRSLGLVLIAAVAPSCTGQPSAEDRCRTASRDRAWDAAITACKQAASGRDPAIELLLAAALDGAGRKAEALAAAERLFDSRNDAGARQIAGGIRLEQGDLGRAEPLLERALAGHRSAGDPTQTARTAHLLAGLFVRERRLSNAMRVARLAVDQADRAGDPLLRGRVRLGLAKVLTQLGDERRARAVLVEAGSLLATSPVDQAWVFLTHGVLLLELGDAAGAVGFLTSARELAAAHGVAPVVEAAALNLAFAERMRGRLDAAAGWIDALAPEVRAQPTAAYTAGLIAADRGDDATAEHLLAAAASRAPDRDYTRDIAHQRGVLAGRRGDAALAERLFRESIAAIESIRDRTEELEHRPWVLHHRRAPYEALFRLLAGQRRALEALEIADRLHALGWRDALGAAAGTVGADDDGPPVGAPRPPLPGPALLDALGEGEALVFVESGDALWRFHLSRGEAELTALAAGTLDAARAWSIAPDDDALADRLGANLLPRDLRAGPAPLYLVTGDGLATLPFAALRRRGRRLVEARPLARLPALAALRCSRRPEVAPRPALVLGDPGGDLPLARREAERVAAQLSVEPILGERATAGRVLEGSGAWLLHVAAHADVDARGGVLHMADGPVEAGRILALRVAPRLAVLAGCATAATRAPEGWGSLPSSFLAAGTRTVVATLRPMSDQDAGALFERFYREGGAVRPAAALAAAQRDLARSARPHRWAPVAVWGAPEPDACH